MKVAVLQVEKIESEYKEYFNPLGEKYNYHTYGQLQIETLAKKHRLVLSYCKKLIVCCLELLSAPIDVFWNEEWINKNNDKVFTLL